ncbi:MAG: peroxidase-related enzyme [Acidimicrobiales bacterium]
MTDPESAAAPISRFPVPKLDELPDDIRTMIETVQEKSGFVPNVFLALANRPDEFRAFFAHHDALMDRSDGLSKAERELIVVATSARNSCLYCVVAHGAILRIRSKRPFLADQVATNPWKADLSERERHIVDFALRMVDDSASITDADLEAMRRHGFSDDEIWDIGAITAFFAQSNRLANLTSMRPNDEFYTMGR